MFQNIRKVLSISTFTLLFSIIFYSKANAETTIKPDMPDFKNLGSEYFNSASKPDRKDFSSMGGTSYCIDKTDVDSKNSKFKIPFNNLPHIANFMSNAAFHSTLEINMNSENNFENKTDDSTENYKSDIKNESVIFNYYSQSGNNHFQNYKLIKSNNRNKTIHLLFVTQPYFILDGSLAQTKRDSAGNWKKVNYYDHSKVNYELICINKKSIIQALTDKGCSASESIKLFDEMEKNYTTKKSILSKNGKILSKKDSDVLNNLENWASNVSCLSTSSTDTNTPISKPSNTLE